MSTTGLISSDLSNEFPCEATPPNSGLPWFAIRVRPRWEKLVATSLRSKEYEEFLPLYVKRSQWSDRVKEVELPLFAGYVFCRANLAGHAPLVTTPGVIGILSFGGGPAVISAQDVEALKTVIRSGIHAAPCPYISKGQRVRIQCGALAGLEGTLVRTKHACRIVLSVEVLLRAVAVEIDRGWVTPVPPCAPVSYA